jgi:pimeloyl-ACP methyl ester carboxylesterase
VCLPKILHFFYRVVALDLRGYGESDKPSGVSSYEEELLRDDIRDVIKAATIGVEKWLGMWQCSIPKLLRNWSFSTVPTLQRLP